MAEILLPQRSAGSGGRRPRVNTPDASDIKQVQVPSDPGVRVPAGAFGADIGAAAEQFRRAASTFSDSVTAIAERGQREFDATQTLGRKTDYERAVNADWEKALRDDDPADPAFVTRWEGIVAKRRDSALAALPEGVSPLAREKLRLTLEDHGTQALREAARATTVAGQKKAQDTIFTRVNVLGAELSRNPAALEDTLRTFDSEYDGFRGTMTADAERDTHRKSQQILVLQAIAGHAKSGRYGAAEALLADKRYDAVLDAEARNGGLAIIDRGRRADAAELRQVAPDHFASIAETGQGVPGLSSKAGAVLEPGQIAEFRAQETRARKVFDIGNAITFAPPDQVRAEVDKLKPTPGSTTYADESSLYAQVQMRAQRMMQARAENPAAYAMQEPSVATAYDAAAKNPALLPAAVSRSLAVQEAIGIPPAARRVLPNAKGEVARITTLPPEQAANAIESMASQYGPHWGAAYRDLVKADLPPEYVVLATLDGPQDAVVRQQVASALQAGRSTMVSNIGPKTKGGIDRDLDVALAPWARLELSRGGTEKNVAAMRSAAELLAYANHARGLTGTDAANAAVKALITDRYDTLDDTNFALYVPKGLGPNVEATGLRILDGLSADNLIDPGGGHQLTADQRKAEYLKQAKRGRWLLDETGEGAFLVDPLGQPVMTAHGRVQFGFNDAYTDPQEPYERTGTGGAMRRTIQRKVR